MSNPAVDRYLNRRQKGTRREVVTPEGIPLGLTLADAGERAAAFLLDFGIMALAIIALVFLLALAGGGGEDSLVLAFVLLFFFLLRSFYFSWFEIRWQGATPGKRIIGLRVIDHEGGPLRAEAVIARNLMREVEVFLPMTVLVAPEQAWPGAPGWAQILSSLWLFVFALMPLFNRDRLRVGDMVAGTMVVLAPKTLLLGDIGGAEVERAQRTGTRYTFTDEQLDIYGIYELQVLENVLRGGQDQLQNQMAMDTVCERIKTKIGWSREQWRVDAERFLREFYAALRARLEHKMLFGKRQADKYDRKK